MQNRTFLRTMLETIFDNAIVRTFASLVNFCKEQQYFEQKKLKFLEKMPIKHVEVKQKYNTRFLFNGNLKVEDGKLL